MLPGTRMVLSLMLPILVCASILFGDSSALECFECNSHIDKRCADSVPPDSLKRICHNNENGIKYSLCRKIDQTVDFSVYELKPERRIIRTCGWDESRFRNQCYEKGGYGGYQKVCSCYGNNCNAGDGHTPIFFLVLSSSFILGILTRELYTL
ncbi:uncharacterized protein LOC124304878 isoform X2 [Neodiprion virginianus]|uniref:uncharacterized protein LOC124304878 isoform X2 n=1 Tax=Neodiprion virginianus TaxID=2961670 RepID=UPI001EE6BB6E|nr:uncharacterized protein LOC124304878 isoform X2 [Neodiprion virginianus]